MVDILHQVETYPEKKCSFWSVHANVSHCFSQLNGILGQARNAWWVVCFCQFLWVDRWLNVWLLNCIVGIMLGKENYIRSTDILTWKSKHTWGAKWGKIHLTGWYLIVQVAIVVAMKRSHNSYLLLSWRCGKLIREQELLQLSLQCVFRGQAVDKERLTGKAEEESNLRQ